MATVWEKKPRTFSQSEKGAYFAALRKHPYSDRVTSYQV